MSVKPNRYTPWIIAALLTLAVAAVLSRSLVSAPAAAPNQSKPDGGLSPPDSAEPTLELTLEQLKTIKIDAVGTRMFSVDKEAVGSIDFDDDLSVQVFPSCQGKILKAFVELGDDVQKGQPLYTIDSPDLVQAESNLIGAAATLELTAKELARDQELIKTKAISNREMEQAINDQQTAEGALKAARDAVRIFGKSEAEIDAIVSARKIDPALVVPSPVGGRITSMAAPPGLLVQPGNPPAPYAVADISTMWMLGNVSESDMSFFHVGQPVHVSTMAYPGRAFDGKISKIYATVDPNTHRVTIRSEIADPQHELRPGMLADFLIRVKAPESSTAIKSKGVVRNGDGTYAAWVTADDKHFTQRIISVGVEQDGWRQVLQGLKPGERAVSEGAVFLSSMLEAPPAD